MRSDGRAEKSFNHPLMQDNITRLDLDSLIEYLQTDSPRLTQGAKVEEFECAWSDWLGVRYSVFVNSGSSANLITLAVLKEITGIGEVIVPPLTWVSDVAACLHNGFTPRFIDIDRETLALDTKQTIAALNDDTKAVFLTHIQGFNGLTQELLDELEGRGIPLLEDVCESHGATFNGRKLGSFGMMSNFSFYFAHHMSTIEGGMVCTNDESVYQMLRMYRSHGMVREASGDQLQAKYSNEYPKLNSDFIFAYPAYNVRNTEIGAVLGLSQLKRLDENNLRRCANHDSFFSQLDAKRFRTEYRFEGSCNYAFNVVLREPDHALRDQIETVLSNSGVEFRRGSSGGGNQMRQPYLSENVCSGDWASYPEVEHIHFFGWYIGNYPDLEASAITELCNLLNSV
tara:strand:+ start:933 stop:2129 length:1197 start_codon:yes stop_codon:yes gene_type:complete